MDKLAKILEGIKHRLPDGVDLTEPATQEEIEQRLAREDREARQEDRERKTAILLKRIAPRFQNAIPRHPAALEWLDGYFEDRSNRNLLITGPAKTGKTWEANAVSIRLLRRFVPVTIIEVVDLMEALRPGGEDDFGAGLAPYKAAPVLVLDDLGVEKTSEWVVEQLDSLINFRYKNLLPMIVTTNLTFRELEARYGERAARRIVDDATIIKLTERYRG